MNIHEYQVKKIFEEYDLPIPKGLILTDYHDAIPTAISVGGKMWVVKAQIHSGGRGLAGGVKLARSLKEVEQLCKDMLGSRLVTNQTGPEGKVVEKVYIERGVKIKYELYDILHFVNHMANIYDIDLEEAIIEKDKINEIKYKREEE